MKNQLAEIMQNCRKNNTKYTQNDVAKKLKISNSLYRMAENGQRKLTYANYEKLVKILKINGDLKITYLNLAKDYIYNKKTKKTISIAEYKELLKYKELYLKNQKVYKDTKELLIKLNNCVTMYS